MKKSVFALALLSTLTVSAAFADGWQTGVSYLHIKDDSNGKDVSVGVAAATLGYEIKQGDFSIIPEIRLGTGVKDDDTALQGQNVNLEVDRLASIGVKLQYEAADNLFVYATPTYTNLKTTAKGSGVRVTESEKEFGVGLGLGYQFNKALSLDVGYEKYDDTDIVQAGIRYTF